MFEGFVLLFSVMGISFFRLFRKSGCTDVFTVVREGLSFVDVEVGGVGTSG